MCSTWVAAMSTNAKRARRDPSAIKKTADAECGDRIPAARVCRLIDALLARRQLTVTEARAAMGLRSQHRAREIIRSCLEALPGHLQLDRSGRRHLLRLNGVVCVPITAEETIASCFAASIAPLFRGTRYEAGMKSVLQAVVTANPRAERFQDLERRFLFLSSAIEPQLDDRRTDLESAARAVLDRFPIRFDYASAWDEKRESVRAEPWAIAIHEHRLYLIGRGPRAAPWVWRFSRMSKVRVLRRGQFTYPTLEVFDPTKLFEHSFGLFLQAGEPQEVVILLAPRWKAYLRSHRWHRSEKHSDGPDGRAKVTLRVRLCPQLTAWILSFGAEAEVIGPDHLREEVRKALHSALARYA